MTETFKQSNKTIIHECGEITLQTAQVLEVGQEVYLSGNNTVSKRTTGTQFPIGTVSTPSRTGDTNVVVKTVLERVIQGIAIGGTLSAGAFVKPNGNVSTADQLPEYVAAASGDFAGAILMKGGAANAIIEVGILESPVRIP